MLVFPVTKVCGGFHGTAMECRRRLYCSAQAEAICRYQEAAWGGRCGELMRGCYEDVVLPAVAALIEYEPLVENAIGDLSAGDLVDQSAGDLAVETAEPNVPGMRISRAR